VQLVTEREQS